MMMRTTLLALAVAAALSGCVVSHVDPQKPELPLPDSLPAVERETVQLPDPWWTLFGDPVLNQLVDEALAHNTDVAVAAARVQQARSALRITNADRLPTLDLEANAGRSKTSGDVFAIPGVSRTQTRPVWNGKEFAPRQMLPLSLSYDHRVIDGASAARFITYLSQVIADPRRALL